MENGGGEGFGGVNESMVCEKIMARPAKAWTPHLGGSDLDGQLAQGPSPRPSPADAGGRGTARPFHSVERGHSPYIILWRFKAFLDLLKNDVLRPCDTPILSDKRKYSPSG